VALRELGPEAVQAGRLHLILAGGFRLQVDGETQPLPLVGQRLLVLVALHGPMSRRRAAFTLWPEATESRAFGSLRTALFRLRGSYATPLIHEGADGLALSPLVSTDVRRAELLVEQLVDSGLTPAGRIELKQILRRGELLPDWYEDWVLVERERFDDLRERAVDSRGFE
jgi:DNA-binding SARP family transcriptional activator